jgi:hypothetical protein
MHAILRSAHQTRRAEQGGPAVHISKAATLRAIVNTHSCAT